MLHFYLVFGKMTFPVCDVRLVGAGLAIIRGRMRTLIRVKELAATHTPDKMRRVRMLEKQAAWK